MEKHLHTGNPCMICGHPLEGEKAREYFDQIYKNMDLGFFFKDEDYKTFQKLSDESIDQIELILDIQERDVKSAHCQQYLQELYDWYNKAVGANHNGCTCQHCGNKFKIDFLIPDDLWKKIRPGKEEGKAAGSGLLCGTCIIKALESELSYSAFRLVRIN